MAMPNRTFYHIAPDGTKTETTIDPSDFTLTTPPGTDIWRPSFTSSRFDAPHILTPLPHSGTLKSLRVTISAPWTTKFDQGGLLLLWPSPSGDPSASKWLKTGIEFFNGAPALSVVGCDRLSDWSLAPLPTSAGSEGRGEATVSVEKEGSTLWVYAVMDDGKGGEEKMPLREIKWALQEGREAGAELWVGVCAAKPADGDGEGELTVRFRDWVVETER